MFMKKNVFSLVSWKPDFSYFYDVSPNSELMTRDDLRCLLFDDDEDCVNTHSDVWLLANERRMDSIRNNPEALKRFTADLNSSRQSGPQFSDSELLEFCKSRNIQTLSELRSWSYYLDRCINDLKVSENEKSSFRADSVDTNAVKEVAGSDNTDASAKE